MSTTIYAKADTPYSIKASGGDATITATSVAQGAGRVSTRIDLTARYTGGYTPAEWRWRVRFKVAGTPAIGRTVRLYLMTADGASADGAFANADAAVASEDVFRNAIFLGAVEVDQVADTTRDFVRSGSLWLRATAVQLGIYNDTNTALSATAADACEFTLYPVPDGAP